MVFLVHCILHRNEIIHLPDGRMCVCVCVLVRPGAMQKYVRASWAKWQSAKCKHSVATVSSSPKRFHLLFHLDMDTECFCAMCTFSFCISYNSIAMRTHTHAARIVVGNVLVHLHCFLATNKYGRINLCG